MQIDIAGKVREKKIANNNVLLPLYEAVVNSIHAIEDGKVEKGIIEIELIRLNQEEFAYENLQKLPPIIDFHIKDNGIGFDEKNFESFNFAHSSYKMDRGGKGIGRITWLRAFDKAIIESQFKEGGLYKKRTFTFEPTKQGIENLKVSNIDKKEGFWSTIVILKNLKEEYRKWCNNNVEDIAFKIIEHCFLFFLNPKCPRIVLKDNKEHIVVNDYFSSYTRKAIDKKTFNIGINEFNIDIIRVYNLKSNNKVHLLAHKREVSNFPISEIVPEIPNYFADEENDKFSVVMYVSGNYFDENVNEERTEIIFDNEDNSLFDDKVTHSILKDTIGKVIRKSFEEQLKKYSKKKIDRIRDFTISHPRYRHLLKYKLQDVLAISNSIDDSKLEIELFKIQQKLELEVLNETKLELQDIANKEQKINDSLYEKVLDVGNAKLSEYVLHRKQVLDLLEFNLRKENGIYTKEEAIHNLIFPLRKTSDDIFLEEHNLWVIDDRLSFHDYLASDKTFKSNKRVPSVSTKETDLMIFNRAHLLTDEQKPYSSIIIIEFKRPMRNDYTNSENPINQINTYVRELIDNKVFDKNGRLFDIKDKTPIYAYIVCDLTSNMRKFAEEQGFTVLPDNDGYFNYNRNYYLYTEIISFDKLIRDSKNRNKVLFEKLHLPTC